MSNNNALAGLMRPRNGTRGVATPAHDPARARLLLQLARLDPPAALSLYDSRLEGLDAAQVEQRFEVHGQNVVGGEADAPWYVEIARRVVTPTSR